MSLLPKVMTLAELHEAAKKDDGTAEHAYRRGVHQSLSYIGDFLRERGEVSAADVCDVACDIAGELRFDGKGHPLLLSELVSRLAATIRQ